MSPLDADLRRLREILVATENDAADLPWAQERPWRADTHLGTADGLPAVDLHDLSVRLALDTVARVLGGDLQTGGVVWITGRGRRSGGVSPLRRAVLGLLEAREGVVVRPRGPARIEVIVDPDRARRARPGLGVLFWLVVALAVLGLIAAALDAVR